ncbi:MAG: Hsp20/alpha crystallin family protein [Tepidisphaeraceae bacterium]
MSVTLATDRPFGHVSNAFGKLAEQFNKGFYGFVPNETWTPNVNLYETDAAYVVCADLAGVDKDKIDIVVHEQRLILRGARSVPVTEESRPPQEPPRRTRIHLMEIDHGSFNREVELPNDVAAERITASYRNGMLWIELPKR